MRYIPTFESYVYENEINDTLHEASHPHRAWSGKIENIDNLLSWMYDKDILNKGEKAEKDSRFRQYYRFYNDGDFPKGLQSRGVSVYDPKEKIETALEEYIEEFIKKVLAKYTGKYDRKDFRIDTLLGDLYTLQGVISSYDAYALLNYWGKKINTNNSEFESLLSDLRGVYDDLNTKVNAAITSADAFKDVKSWDYPSPNVTLSHRKTMMERADVWTPALQKEYDKMSDLMDKMNKILSTVIQATQDLKKEIGV